MRKGIKITLIVALTAVCLCVAGYFVITSVMGNMHGNIAWKDYKLTYGGNTYHSVDDRFDVVVNKEDTVIQLGWHYNFPFPNMHYHAFENDAPMFIFCDNGEGRTTYNKGLYVKDGFDLDSAMFIVGDTDIEVSMQEAILATTLSAEEIDTSIDTSGLCFLYLYLKNDAHVRASFSGPYLHNDAWYVIENAEIYRLSEEFVSALKANNLIAD